MRKICFEITRSLVIIVNLIVLNLACLLIYISFNAFERDYQLDPLTENQTRLIHVYVSIICGSLGLIIAILSVLGLFGAIKKSKSILLTYAAIILFMIIALLGVALFTYTITSSNSGDPKEVDKSIVNSTIVVYNYVDSSDMKTKIIDKIQKTLTCCGVNSPNDWTEYSLHKIPKSCCSEPVESSLPVFKYCAESDHKIGCWKALTEYSIANLHYVRKLLYILMAFGFVCMAAAGFMFRTLRRTLDVV